MSQPAITQALAKLEQILCAPLFLRRSSGMFLTEPGALFRDRAARALNLVKAGADHAIRAGGGAKPKGRSSFDRQVTSTHLRVLLTVARHGNFSIAARRIGVSQPSLHRAARDLERISGTELYRKSPQGIRLTESAELLARYARLSFAELRQGFEEVDSWRGLDTATITIGTLPLPRSFVLPTAINEMTAARPNVKISVVDGPYDDLLHALRHGEIELLVGALRDPVPIDDVVQEELFCDRLAIYGRADHPLTGQGKITAEELAAYPWVVPCVGAPTRAHFDRLFSSAKIRPPERLVESNSLVPLIRGLLQGSDRLTLISSHLVREEERLGLVKRLPFQLRDTEFPVGMTVRRDWQPTPTQSLLLDSLRRVGSQPG